MDSPRSMRAAGIRDLVIGSLSLAIGVAITLMSYGRAAKVGGTYIVAYGAIVVGALEIVRGIWRLTHQESGAGYVPNRFEQFVAFRYLMAPRPRRVSPPLVGFIGLCLAVGVFAYVFGEFIPLLPPFAWGGGQVPTAMVVVGSSCAAMAVLFSALATVIALTSVGSPRSRRVSLWFSLISGLAAAVVFGAVVIIRANEEPDPALISRLSIISYTVAGLPVLGFVALFPVVSERVIRWAGGAVVLGLCAVIQTHYHWLRGSVESMLEKGESLLLPAFLVAGGLAAGAIGIALYAVNMRSRSGPLPEARTAFRETPDLDRMAESARLRTRGLILIAAGVFMFVGGLFVGYLVYGGVFAAVAGGSQLQRSFYLASMATHKGRAELQRQAIYDRGVGRYETLALEGGALLVLGVALFGLLLVGSLTEPVLASLGMHPGDEFRPLWLPGLARGALILGSIGVALTVIRYYFSFFTTVSIGGVMVGTMALIMVLSVMGGFESDLRQKILGSNAHILVTRHDGEFHEYRDVGRKIAEVPTVEAYSPYVVSEVVIAARQNYANVIIKGIDPMRVGKVTQLEDDIEQKYDRPLERLYPLAADGGVLGPPPDGAVPAAPIADAGPVADATDPAPPDLDVPDFDPVDLSGGWVPGVTDVSADAGPSGARVPDELDPPPDDLAVPDDTSGAPIDLSGGLTADEVRALEPDAGPDNPAVGGTDSPFDSEDSDPDSQPPFGTGELDDDQVIARDLGLGEIPPMSLSPEIAELPGVLIGRELVKTLSNFVGQEVTVVSPLGEDTPLGPVPRTKRYRVAGTFYTGMYEYDLKFVYVELTSLQDFLDIGDQVNGIEVRITDPNDSEVVMEQLRSALGPEYRVQDWRELNKSLFSALKLEKIAMFIVLAIIILVASFSIVGNLVMIVIEKAREIAVLKTLGASDRGVTDVFIRQGFVIGVLGTLVGVSLGLGHTLITLQGFPLDPNVYYIDRLPIALDKMNVVYVAVAALVISSLATVYPASLASAQRPVEGLARE